MKGDLDSSTLSPDDRFVRLREIVLRTGLARATVYRRIQQGKFPPPKKDGFASVWRESDLLKYMMKVDAGEG